MKTLGAWLRAFPPHTIGGSGTGVVAYTDLANIFTAQQKVQTSGSGEDGIVSESTANSASASGNYKLRRTRTGVANDVLGHFEWEGKNAGAADLLYALDYCIIIDPTVGVEHSRRGIRTKRAGVDSDWYFESGALRHQAQPQPANVGEMAAADFLTGGVSIKHGVAQWVRSTTTSYFAVTTQFPDDDSIPQNNEGVEILTRSITPKHAGSTLVIIGTVQMGGAQDNWMIGALFVDSVAGALNVGNANVSSGIVMSPLVVKHAVAAGSTAARTYKLRVGRGSGSEVDVNGDTVGRKFGGVMTSSLEVIEVLPQ